MSLLSLPDQTIPETQKTKEWHILHATNYASYSLSDHYSDQRRLMLKYYRAYNAELSSAEHKLTKVITCPNGMDLGIEYIVYPLIQTKIEQFIGEFLLRPIRRKAYAIDKKSKNKKFEEKLKMLGEEIMRDLAKKMESQLGFSPETENSEMELPADVEEFFEKDYKTIAEEVADGLLNLFLDVNKEKNKLKEYFLDYCITDRAHAVLHKLNGHTRSRKVQPMDCDYDIDPYKVVQNDHEYFFENYYLTENEIYNTFTSLTKDEKEGVKMFFTAIGDQGITTPDSEELTTSQKYDGWYQTNNKVSRLRIISAMWKSRKRVSVKTNTNKDGREFHKKLKEKDEVRKNDNIRHLDGEAPRMVLMLGPDICLDYGKMENRYSSVDAPWKCRLPVVSIIRDNTTGTSLIKSPAAKLYQLQQMASEVLFEIRLALKSAGDSRVIVYDAAQTPKDFSKGGFQNGLNRVMHHIKKDKLMIINSAEKGFKKGSFNPISSLDLSQKGGIQDLFNGLAIIEDLGSKFIGITPEREGQVGQYQTATGTDKAIRGSTARTETIYTPFDEFIQSMLEMVLLRAKHDYEEGEVLQFIFGEMKTKFMKLFKEFFLSDMGIYLSDARKDKQAAETIDRAVEQALSHATTPDIIMGLIEVYEGESASEKKAVFQRMLNSMEKLRAEQAKAEQEAAAAQVQAEAQDKTKDRDVQYAGHDKDRDVANIYVDGKGMDRAMDNKSKQIIKSAELEADSKKETKKE